MLNPSKLRYEMLVKLNKEYSFDASVMIKAPTVIILLAAMPITVNLSQWSFYSLFSDSHLMLYSFFCVCRERDPLCWVLRQCQPQPWQPIQWVPDPVSLVPLPALFPRGGHLHRDWVLEAAGADWALSSLSQTGLPVPRDLRQCSQLDSRSAHLLSPYRCQEALHLHWDVH